MAIAYSGVFRAGTDAHALWVAQWPSFEAKWKELSGNGLRLTSLSVGADGGQPQFAGVFRAGTDTHALWVAQWPSFEAKWKELSGQGLRLVSLAAYVVNGQPYFGGVFRAGTDPHALWVAQWPSFEAKWKELSGQGLRLVSLATYVVNGQPYFGGVFRAGTDAHALWVAQWPSFEAKWKELSGQGLRMVSLDSYMQAGKRYYAGVFRAGGDGHLLWVGVDWENFSAKWHHASKQGLRLVDMAAYPHTCTGGCLNQVVMPATVVIGGEAKTNTGYVYQITGDTAKYRWPVDTDGTQRYARLSALQPIDSFLTLPFADSAVKRRGIWRYGNGGWHHAGDYQRDDVATFKVLAAAPGRVIFVGWDNWSGNTIVMSHDVGGVTDAYRTIYMHLRNGASNDCQAAWAQTVPSLSDPELSEYVQHLEATGCPKNPPRNPDPAHWGTTTEVIDPGLVGKTLPRGAFLAWAGNTGPGGKRGAGGPNTHLHIFFCRRDPTDNQWYFFDPYGIYSMPDCYPAGITDSIGGPCARYPNAWMGGRPQYP
jgi:hypothetical protein